MHPPTSPTSHMTHPAKKILYASTILLGVFALVWLGAHLFTDRSQLARTIAWMDSDLDDYSRFPMRRVANAAPRFDFRPPSAAVRERYAPVFAKVTTTRGNRATTQSLGAFLAQTETVAFLVIKDDTLLYEQYFNGYDHDATVTSFSTGKSFVSALVGIAIAEGHIGSVEDPVTKYVPELLQRDPRYRHITLRHLLTMASGIHYEESGTPWGDDARTYYSPDLRALALSSPIIGKPGQGFNYNNYHPLLLGLVLERTTGRPVAKYLEEKLWKPLGMEAPGSWSLDSEQSGFEKMESGINGRAIDFAKFGRLFLNRGNWNGTQLVPAAWVDASTRLDTRTDPAPFYQYFWWINTDARGHHYLASGKHGQKIYIVPEQRLIFVRFGKADPYRHWEDLFEDLAGRMAAADASPSDSL